MNLKIDELKIHEMNCALFKGLTTEEIERLIETSALSQIHLLEGETLFEVGTIPISMFILIKGAVSVEKVDINGKRSVVNSFHQKGTVFGEVYLYLEERLYDYSCRALEETVVLAIPKDFMVGLKNDEYDYYRILISNMLQILSEKAFYLNQKVQILSSYTLRQKIANYLYQRNEKHPTVELPFNREQFAEYIGTTRPSLSRELMSMEDDGLICVNKTVIEIREMQQIEDLI